MCDHSCIYKLVVKSVDLFPTYSLKLYRNGDLMYNSTVSTSSNTSSSGSSFAYGTQNTEDTGSLLPGLAPIFTPMLPGGLSEDLILEGAAASSMSAYLDPSSEGDRFMISTAAWTTDRPASVESGSDSQTHQCQDILLGQSTAASTVGTVGVDPLVNIGLTLRPRSTTPVMAEIPEADSILRVRTRSASDVAGDAVAASAAIVNQNNRQMRQLEAAGASSQSNWSYFGYGTLGADTFRYVPGFSNAVIMGNGNVHYGSGHGDTINLSSISFYSTSMNLASAQGGGVVFNPGNGLRVFDSIQFSNGTQMLFEGIDRIRFAEGIVNLAVTPNDPLFSQQWNLHMMGVHNAWRFTQGSSQVMVGVQDTGLGFNSQGAIHPDFDTTNIAGISSNIEDDYFRTFLDSGYGPRTTSHGTSVHGIIGAQSNNGLGMSGINWNSQVVNIDVLDGNPGDLSLAQATQSMINYATQQGTRLVINMSLGGRGGIDPAFEQVVATNQNSALFVISAGNDDQSELSNPGSLAARYSNVIAVGASWGTNDIDGNPRVPGTRISYPGWWGSNYGTGLTLMAPSEVIAPTANRVNGDVQFGYTGGFNGTSAAAPNVAGVASLVWSANSGLSASSVRRILEQTAHDLGDPGYDLVYGHGFVNADAAVRQALVYA